MQVPFRQGIIYAPHNFLTSSGGFVSLNIPPNQLVTLNFADSNSNYVVNLTQSVTNAWSGPFVNTTDYWLYWDINIQTGELSYGFTELEPIEGPTSPVSPQPNQHWFDTTVAQMFVWNAVANKWQRKIRLFAAHLMSGSVLVSMSINSPSFAGTQVGDLSTVNAGSLVFDANGTPLKKGDGTFFTTADVAITSNSANTHVKFETIVIAATANEPIPAYTMVRFTDFHKISIANNLLEDPGIYGIVEVNANTGDIVNVIREGVVHNPSWNWLVDGINAPVYVTITGQLTTSVQPSRAVGIVLSPTSLLLTDTIVDSIAAIDAVVTINSPTSGVTITGTSGPTSSSFNIELTGNVAAVDAVNTPGVVFRSIDGLWTARQLNLTTDVTNILPTANGGTGTNDLTGYVYAPAIGAPYTATTHIPGSHVTGNISGNAANVTGVVSIANGGTGSTTRTSAINALLPLQSSVSTNKALFSNGVDVEWRDASEGTVTSVGISSTSPNMVITNTPVTSTGVIDIELTGNLQGIDILSTAGIVTRGNTGNIETKDLVSNGTINITNGDATSSGNIRLDLAVVNIPQSYTRVTTDEFGRVTSGDVTLDWSFIDNKPVSLAGHGITNAYTKAEVDAMQWNWSSISSTPTTLSGYGIVDAYTTSQTNALTWHWNSIHTTPDTMAGYGIVDGVVNAGGADSISVGSSINKPPAGVNGRLFIDTTTQTISYDNGAVWNVIGAPGSVTSVQITSTNTDIDVIGGPIANSGTFTISTSGNLDSVSQLSEAGFITRSTDGVWNQRAITGAAGNIMITNSLGTTGNVVVDLANIGVAGTYTQVNVDTKGRVTGGVTGSTLSWNIITDTPTTVTGYGITDALTLSQRGAADGVASLDASGKIPTSQLPPVAITETHVVNSQIEMLSLTAQTGDIAVRLDEEKTYILRGAIASNINNWQEILTSAGGGGVGVTSVNVSSSTNNIVVSGGPILDSGTIALSLAGNLSYAAELTGSGFVRATPSAWSVVSMINLGTDTSGTLGVANGGTGTSSLAVGYVRSSGSGPLTSTTTVPGTDVTGNISGNAANVTGVVSIANGGTGSTTQQGAVNAILPVQTTAGFLSTDGNNVQWTQTIPAEYITGTITATDALSLNGNPSSYFATANGSNATGTWNITATDALSLNGNPSSYFATANGSNATGTWNININGSSSSATDVTGVVSVANGGTGATTAQDALVALLPDQTGNQGNVLTVTPTGVEWADVADISNPFISDVMQTSHNLVEGDWVTFDGTTYIKASATALGSSHVIGVVVSVQDIDNFTIQAAGAVTHTWGATTPGTMYYLSTTDGEMTSTVSTTPGNVVKPLFYALTATNGIITIGDSTAIPAPDSPYVHPVNVATFANSDLDIDDSYTFAHNINEEFPTVVVYDNSNSIVTHQHDVTIISDNEIKLTLSAVPIVGSWKVKVTK